MRNRQFVELDTRTSGVRKFHFVVPIAVECCTVSHECIHKPLRPGSIVDGRINKRGKSRVA